MTCSFNLLAMLVLVTVSALAAAEEISAAPSCSDVTRELILCLGFLKGKGVLDSPSTACCSGAQAITSQAQTKKDRRAVCECIEDALARIGSSDSLRRRMPLIGKKCGVDVYIPPITGKKTIVPRSSLNIFFDIYHCATLGKKYS